MRLLQECSEIRNLKVSKLMETAPYGYTEQPAFLNGAIELETLFTPQELLIVIHKIEAELGRERVIHWGPRTIDLDIVFMMMNRGRVRTDHSAYRYAEQIICVGTTLHALPGKGPSGVA